MEEVRPVLGDIAQGPEPSYAALPNPINSISCLKLISVGFMSLATGRFLTNAYRITSTLHGV